MPEADREQQLVERFLASPQFERTFGVLETYQRLLAEVAQDAGRIEVIRQRMHGIFDKPVDDDNVPEEGRRVRHQMIKMRQQIFTWCESGELTREKLAVLYAASGFGEMFLSSWDAKSGNKSGNGKVLANEAVEYVNSDGQDEELEINIIPTSVKGRGPLLAKIRDGFQTIARELDSGSLRHVERIRLFSWLFSSIFAQETKIIFGDTVALEEVSTDEGAEEVQHLALSYNKRAMEEYLTSGQLPRVQRLTLTKAEFISKFLPK